MEPENGNGRAWQQSFPAEDRFKVLGHVFEFFPDVPDKSIEFKTNAFEEKAFWESRDKTDYLWRVANALTRAENSVHHQHQKSSPRPVRSPFQPIDKEEFQKPVSENWRSTLPIVHRIRVCQRTMEVVSKIYPGQPKQKVRDFTSNFEHKAYLLSNSRTEYDQRIDKGLNDIESSALPVPPDSIMRGGRSLSPERMGGLSVHPNPAFHDQIP